MDAHGMQLEFSTRAFACFRTEVKEDIRVG